MGQEIEIKLTIDAAQQERILAHPLVKRYTGESVFVWNSSIPITIPRRWRCIITKWPCGSDARGSVRSNA